LIVFNNHLLRFNEGTVFASILLQHLYVLF